jgi:uncharacterized 2Fe-2S/4Fe-4S cluster protein (DUF4445 family)
MDIVQRNSSFMNHTITFLPSNKSGRVPAGARLSDVATMITDTDLHLECGGKGTCGKCLVDLVSGSVEVKGGKKSVMAGEQPKQVPACQSWVCGDATVSIKSSLAGQASSMALGKDIAAIDPALLPDKKDISPVIKKMAVRVEPASLEQNHSDFQRLEKQIRKEAGAAAVIRCGLPLLRTLASVLRVSDGRCTVRIRDEGDALEIVSLDAGDASGREVGIACDIGTTTVSIHCIDLETGSVLASKSDYNAQIRRGADIISRIEYAKTEKRLQEMQHLVLSTINGLIDTACEEMKMSRDDIYNMAIAGNTTMVHLALCLPPQYIRESPYVPTINAPSFLYGADVGLNINPAAAVTFAPGVGSYVGGDITSGLLTTPLINEHDRISLFMDIGTNGEIAVGNAEFLMTCACSAGPAFEGSGIKCGMRAATGAIESFEIDSAMEHIQVSVINGGKPSGICGSGLISLVGELYTKGIIDQGGKIADTAPASRVTRIEGTKGLVLVRGTESSNNKEIIITEADIENCIRTKGAIYAACDLLLSNVGLTTENIDRVYIAGGFGRFIDIEKAVKIGLLPDIERDKFTYLGNSSLTGAALALLSKQRRDQLAALARRMTYIDLSSDHRYMDAYVAALFLPHTDMTRFPSVTRK